MQSRRGQHPSLWTLQRIWFLDIYTGSSCLVTLLYCAYVHETQIIHTVCFINLTHKFIFLTL
ncbi:unnamed protein product [Ixodes pacificus]